MNDELTDVLQTMREKDYKDKEPWEKFYEGNKKIVGRKAARTKENEILTDCDKFDYVIIGKSKRTTKEYN